MIVAGTQRSCLAAVAALAITVACPAARAHGGLPRGHEMIFEPGNPSHLIVRSDLWGLFRTTDGGATWQYVCSEAWRGNFLQSERRSMVLLRGGRLLVSGGFNGLQVADAPCSFAANPHFADREEVVQHVLLGPDGETPYVFTSTGRGGAGIEGRVWISRDGAETWTPLGGPTPTDFSGTQLAVAPADPSRLYVSGKLLDETKDGALLRSSDGGFTWELRIIPVDDADGIPWAARLAAVHPQDPDAVFFWVDRHERLAGDSFPDELWYSENAGQTWARIFRGVGDLPGFGFSPDGATVLVAGPEDGLWNAAYGEIAARGQEAFARIFDGRIWGLAWTDEGLIAGSNDFTPRGIEPFMLGLSRDGGASFERVMDICDVELVDCPEDARTARACERPYYGYGGLVEDYLEGPRCSREREDEPPSDQDTGQPGSAANVIDGGAEGCSCSTLAGGGWSADAALALLLTAMGGLSRRRARAPSPGPRLKIRRRRGLLSGRRRPKES